MKRSKMQRFEDVFDIAWGCWLAALYTLPLLAVGYLGHGVLLTR